VMHLRAVDPGFRVADLYAVNFDLPSRRYDAAAKRAFIDDFLNQVRHLPGVKSATATHPLPPETGIALEDLAAEGVSGLVSHGTIDESPVPSEFFSTIGIPLLEGRTFDDGADERHDVIINQGFARTIWPHQSAIGKHLRIVTGKLDEIQMTIVGVVADVARFNLRGDRTRPMLYTPIGKTTAYPPTHVAVRVTPGTDPIDALRAVAKSIDPRVIPPTITTAAAGLAETMAQDTFTMLLLAVFAGLAVVLSAVGLYGVISFVVTQRTREIGIRIALGATARDVAMSVIGRGVALAVVGLAIGLVGAIWGTKLVRATLFGVTGGDPISFGAAALVLLAVSTLACLRPTSRALSIDPVIAMRGD
jgi:putative ABC transport system permease protein